jgi:hypothetical protein
VCLMKRMVLVPEEMRVPTPLARRLTSLAQEWIYFALSSPLTSWAYAIDTGEGIDDAGDDVGWWAGPLWNGGGWSGLRLPRESASAAWIDGGSVVS